jgi:hypothetical protein
LIPIVLTILLSSVKFAMTFPIAVLQFRFGFLETILWTNLGGLAGIYFFAFLSGEMIQLWNRTFHTKAAIAAEKPNAKKIFTRRNRRIVLIKQRYGLIGIVAATPLLLSIPIGTFLVIRYYSNFRAKFIYLISANLFWSVVYTGFYTFCDGLLAGRK